MADQNMPEPPEGMPEPGKPEPEGEARDVYRATLQIDLTNPSSEQLEAIQNEVAARIARSFVNERSGIASRMAVHDEHNSWHNSG